VRDARLDTDPDFILSGKYDNSLSAYMDTHPNGETSDAAIGRMLDLTDEQLTITFCLAIQKLKQDLT
jgi:hypothetical protein